MWQVIFRGRDFILIFNIKDIIKKSLPLKITCHLTNLIDFIEFFIHSWKLKKLIFYVRVIVSIILHLIN
jgi:hypothetical protein